MHKSKKHFLKHKHKKWNSRKKCYRKKGGSIGDWWDLRTHMCPSSSEPPPPQQQSQLYPQNPEPQFNSPIQPEPQFYTPSQNPELQQQEYPPMGMDVDNAAGKLDTYGGELEKEIENKVGGRRRRRVHRTTKKKKRKYKKSKHSRKQRGKGNFIRPALGNSGRGHPEDDDHMHSNKNYSKAQELSKKKTRRYHHHLNLIKM